MKGGQILFLCTKSHNFVSSCYYKLTNKIFIYTRRYEINKKRSLNTKVKNRYYPNSPDTSEKEPNITTRNVELPKNSDLTFVIHNYQ